MTFAQQRVPRAWTAEELNKVKAAIETQEGTISGMHASAFLMALHWFTWDTGATFSQAEQLRWRDVNFAESVATVDGKQLRLSEVAITAMRKLTRSTEYVFPWTPEQFQDRYLEVIRTALGRE